MQWLHIDRVCSRWLRLELCTIKSVLKFRIRHFCDRIPEYQAAGNTADTTEAYKGSTAESTLPLASDVVRLVRQSGGNVGVGASSNEENAKVSDRGVRVPAHDRDTDQAKDHIGNDDWSSDMVLVTQVAHSEHVQTGKCIGRCHQTLRSSDAKAQIGVENDGQEVGERVGDSSGVEED